MKGISLIIVFLALALGGRAQADSAMLKHASPKMLKKLGKNALKQRDPSSAVTFLEAYEKAKPGDAEMTATLGKAYLEIRDYERAQHAYLRAYKANPAKAPEALYYAAQMQKSNGSYDSARYHFQRFKKEYKGSQKALKKQATKEIAFCDSVQKIVKSERKLLITHLDTTINKVNSEGSPLMLDEKTLLYASVRTDKKEYLIEDDTAEPVRRQLYLANKSGNTWKFAGTYQLPELEGANASNVALSPDGKRLYFTRCKRNLNGKMICSIYVTEKKEGNWSEPVKLPYPVNHKRKTTTMPAVASDPQKGGDLIYFVSDRSGGRGGMDLWYTIYDRKKKLYKQPKNLGSKINTTQDEITPFFDNETRTLFFSSSGWGGLGGFDVYRAVGDGKKFAPVENIGQPFNTGADDIYFTVSPNREEGFFVSNRKGGNALKNSTCCDDIYQYVYPEYVHITLKGVVVDKLENETPLRDVNIDVYLRDKATGDKFFVKSVKTDKMGRYSVQLEPEQDYAVVIRKREIMGVTEEVSTKGMRESAEINRNVKTVKKPKGPVPIPEFNYEFGRADLSDAQKKTLDVLLIDMMNANPEVIVEIQSHTDSKGNELYNQKLSQKRADQIVSYALSRGIDPARLKAVGYGESKPIAPNEKADGSDNPEGRAKNRRTDFKIVGFVEEEAE